MRICVTGCAGFIGSSISSVLLAQNHTVLGIDNFTPNYDLTLKQKNVSRLTSPNFHFYRQDIRAEKKLLALFQKYRPEIVLHLAAIPGVRASLKNPQLYHKVNVVGTETVFKAAVSTGTRKFIFSSSSSVYGHRHQLPLHENMRLYPQSPYAKTKRDAEVILKKLHAKFHLPTLILRLFSVYGPFGRPDMAPFLFTRAAFSGLPITQFGSGNSARDYTYISDVVLALTQALRLKFDWEIINIGHSRPVKLSQLIQIIETATGRKIISQIAPLNQIEPLVTYANIHKAQKILGWSPQIDINQGMKNFIEWYKKQIL